MNALIRVEYHADLRKAIHEATPTDEVRLFCQGAIHDAERIRQRDCPEKPLTFVLEPLNSFVEVTDSLFAAINTEATSHGTLAALVEQVSDIVADEGFEEFLEPHEMAPLQLYSREHAIGVYCHDHSATTLREVICRFEGNPHLKAVIICQLLAGTRLDLEETTGAMGYLGSAHAYKINVTRK